MSKVLIETAGTEFEQNGTDLAMIDDSFRAGKPTMINSADLDEAFDNASQAVKDKISFDVNGQTKTVTPTTSKQVIEPDEGKNALTKVTVNAVTSAIDANIVAGNIKKDVTILGVTGTHEEGGSFKPIEESTAYKRIFMNATFEELPGLTRSDFESLLQIVTSETVNLNGALQNAEGNISVILSENSDNVRISFHKGTTSGQELADITILADSGGAVLIDDDSDSTFGIFVPTAGSYTLDSSIDALYKKFLKALLVALDTDKVA